MSLRNGLLVLTITFTVTGCASYASTDLVSAGYQEQRDGYYVKLGEIKDLKTGNALKKSYRDKPGQMSIYANRPLLAQLVCGQKAGDIGNGIASRFIQLNLEPDAHVSFAPLAHNSAGVSNCKVLVNIVDVDGAYSLHEFDRVVTDAVEGRDVYGYVEAPPKR
ncbi:hypothetical protein [Hydrocarboniphaga sp.]|uniref:hypothetical protein n=1 Tax=Hydrocarboniphaga sp. TaxID=2033016 RepID=UPI003D1055D7